MALEPPTPPHDLNVLDVGFAMTPVKALDARSLAISAPVHTDSPPVEFVRPRGS